MQYFVRVEPYELPERVKTLQKLREVVGSASALIVLGGTLYANYSYPVSLLLSVGASFVSVVGIDA